MKTLATLTMVLVLLMAGSTEFAIGATSGLDSDLAYGSKIKSPVKQARKKIKKRHIQTQTASNRRMTSKQALEQLDKALAAQNIKKYRNLNFAGHLNVASEGNVQLIDKDKTYLQTTFQMLEVLEQTGVDTIQFYVYPEYWEKPQVKDYYDKLVDRIRADGKKLHIGYQGGAKFRHTYASFEEYKSTELSTIKEIAAKYKPDYFSVVVEPKTMEKRGQIDISDDQWVDLTTEASELIKKTSGQTKVVATVTARELGLMNEFSKLDSVDILGLNPYRETLLVPEVVHAVDAMAKKKPIYFPEFWVTGDAHKQIAVDTQVKFIKFVLGFSQEHEIHGLAPFYSKRFVTFSDKLWEQKQALDRGERTELFYTYKDFISAVRSNT